MSRRRLSIPAAPEVGLLVSAPRVRVVGQVESNRVSVLTQAVKLDGVGISLNLRKSKIVTEVIGLRPGFSATNRAGAQ